MRFQSDSPVGVSSEAGVCWWPVGGWGSISVSSGSVGVVTGLNQLVIGFVLSGGSCRLCLFLVWRGLGSGFRGLCGGGLSSICVSVCVPGCAPCAPSAMVLIVFVCVSVWALCFFGGGRTGDVVIVSLSRVRVRGPSVRFVIPFRDVTADPYLISVKFVPQVSTHDVRCAGCVSVRTVSP